LKSFANEAIDELGSSTKALSEVVAIWNDI
jgi:hypothetical protein